MGKFFGKKKNQNRLRKKIGKKRGLLEKNSLESKSKDPGCPKFGGGAKVEKKKKNRRGKNVKTDKLPKSLSGLLLNAEKRDDQFASVDDSQQNDASKSGLNQNFKKCFKEFKKVIEAADVIIEVLDARDPLGSRCKEVEQAVIDAGPDKRLILLINKIDLVPRENLEKWLKYLRQEFPTVAFKASTQSQNSNLSHSKVAAIHMSEKLQSSSRCIGAKYLMKVLGNYCRNKNVLMSIKVGVVGFPNVGKSSIINSLKRCHACDTGSTPGITKVMQEIILDKHVRLLDCPGVVFAKEGSESSLALRNAIKIETLDDVLKPAEAIIQRVDRDQLCEHYKIPRFSSVDELLFCMARKIGRFKKGGVPDLEAAALKLINDWNSGVIKYYTHPPEVYEPMIQISAEIVKEMSEAFDISSLMEGVEFEEMLNEDDQSSEVLQPSISETMEVISEDKELEKVGKGISDKDGKSSKSGSVTAKFNSKKKGSEAKDEKGVDVLRFQKNKQLKKMFKKMKKKRRRDEKVSAALSETLDSVLNDLMK